MTINEIIANWKLAQDAGAVLPCPRCGGMNMDAKLTRNALSRRTGIYICSRCGTEEAVEDIPYSKSAKEKFARIPVSRWFITENVFGEISTDVIGRDCFNVNASLDLFVSKEDIDDIMCCALEGGITYWCSKAVVIGKYLGEYASEQISRNGCLNLWIIEGDGIRTLTLESVLKGIKLASKKATLKNG